MGIQFKPGHSPLLRHWNYWTTTSSTTKTKSKYNYGSQRRHPQQTKPSKRPNNDGLNIMDHLNDRHNQPANPTKVTRKVIMDRRDNSHKNNAAITMTMQWIIMDHRKDHIQNAAKPMPKDGIDRDYGPPRSQMTKEIVKYSVTCYVIVCVIIIIMLIRACAFFVCVVCKCK